MLFSVIVGDIAFADEVTTMASSSDNPADKAVEESNIEVEIYQPCTGTDTHETSKLYNLLSKEDEGKSFLTYAFHTKEKASLLQLINCMELTSSPASRRIGEGLNFIRSALRTDDLIQRYLFVDPTLEQLFRLPIDHLGANIRVISDHSEVGPISKLEMITAIRLVINKPSLAYLNPITFESVIRFIGAPESEFIQLLSGPRCKDVQFISTPVREMIGVGVSACSQPVAMADTFYRFLSAFCESRSNQAAEKYLFYYFTGTICNIPYIQKKFQYLLFRKDPDYGVIIDITKGPKEDLLKLIAERFPVQ